MLKDASPRTEVPIRSWEDATCCHHPPISALAFTSVNRALRGHPSIIPLSASGEVRAALLDLRQLVTTLAARSTHVKEILPAYDPEYIGYCDASAFVVGGVWFLSGMSPIPETVWQLQWPLDITSAVISESNPTGTLTNSDLQMAPVVLQLNVLEPLVPWMHHKLMYIHSENTPSVAWLTKMATKTANSDAAHRLVRGLALCQQMLHSAPVSITSDGGFSFACHYMFHNLLSFSHISLTVIYIC